MSLFLFYIKFHKDKYVVKTKELKENIVTQDKAKVIK